MSNTWDASLYNQKHTFVFEYGKDVLDLLTPRPGERILDVGCGTGYLTAAIAQAGARVVGMDNAPAMIEAARRDYPELDFRLADATSFVFDEPFDAVFSNAALHWATPPEQAVGCIARALRPGGRFVAELGGSGNIASIVAEVEQALQDIAHIRKPHGWYFPSIGTYASLLEGHQLAVQGAWLFDRPTLLDEGEAGLRNFLAMFGGGWFEGIAAETYQQVVGRVEARLRPRLFEEGQWRADYRRLRIVACKQ